MIIIGKFRGKFRERFPEWVTSFGMLFWGLVTLSLPELFDQPYFYPLSLFMSQPFWGVLSTFTGLLGIGALLVNGLWRPTAHFRAISAILRITVWSSLLMASATTDGRVLGVPTFLMLVILDIAALWWAAGDAKLADQLAKKVRANGRSSN
jgi:hypothetical protein